MEQKSRFTASLMSIRILCALISHQGQELTVDSSGAKSGSNLTIGFDDVQTISI